MPGVDVLDNTEPYDANPQPLFHGNPCELSRLSSSACKSWVYSMAHGTPLYRRWRRAILISPMYGDQWDQELYLL